MNCVPNVDYIKQVNYEIESYKKLPYEADIKPTLKYIGLIEKRKY
jgi:hypothetical protein